MTPDQEKQFDQFVHNTTNHAPSDESVIKRFEEIRAAAWDLGHTIISLSPPCREQSLALTNLEQTVMWAVASIARNQDSLPTFVVE